MVGVTRYVVYRGSRWMRASNEPRLVVIDPDTDIEVLTGKAAKLEVTVFCDVRARSDRHSTERCRTLEVRNTDAPAHPSNSFA